MSARQENTIKKDIEDFKKEMIHEFHMISEGLVDQIKLLAEGHSGIIQRLDQIEKENKLLAEGQLGIIQRLDGMQKEFDKMRTENEHQHSETRALIKISFSQLDRRLSDLESQMKELQEWRKEVESRPRI